jgi:hypothetical protein
VPVRPHRLLILSIAAVAASVAATAWLPPKIRPPGDAVRAGPGRPAPADAATLARTRLLARLDAADAEVQRALAARLDALAARFAEQRRQLPALAGRLLGLPAQWRYLADRLPIGSRGRLAAFLREELRGTLLDPSCVRALVAGTIAGYRRDEHAIEDRLLVQLRLDLPDLPTATADITADDPAAPIARDAAAPGASIVESLRVELGHEAAALAAGEVLAGATLRCAARAGLCAAGRAGVAASLGVGLAAGLLAERALATAWGDPRDELARRLGKTMDALERELIEGHARSPGLRPRLGREQRGRAAQRRSTLLRAAAPGGTR